MTRHASCLFVSTFVAVAAASACAGSTKGGSDGETHFSCVADDDCTRVEGAQWCVAGTCQATRAAVEVGGVDAGGDGTAPPQDGATAHSWLPPEPMTVSGNLLPAPGVTFEGSIYVAVVWHEVLGSDPEPDRLACGNPAVPLDVQYRVIGGQQVKVSEVGPYSLTLSERPPALARSPSWASGGEWAYGHLIVYRDGNENGVLDRASPFEASPDVVLGLTTQWGGFGMPEPNMVSYHLYFADIAVPNSPTPSRGFNVTRFTVNAVGGTDHGAQDQAPVESVDIVLDPEDRHASTLACSGICNAASYDDCPAQIPDLPPHGVGMCQPQMLAVAPSYAWERTLCTGCNCRTEHCAWYREPGLPVPHGWPCDLPDGGP